MLKSLYGLPQAGRNWYLLFCGILSRSLGMTKSRVEGCNFSKVNKKLNMNTFVQFHVDDNIMESNDKVFADKVMEKMHELFGGTRIWKSKEFDFLQMHITRQDDYSITVDNAAYVMDIVERRYLENMAKEFSKHRGCITPSNLELFMEEEDPNYVPVEQDKTDYKGAIGELIHALYVRIDILKEVTFLAKKSEIPGPKAWKAYRRIIHYLYHFPSLPINFRSKVGDIVTCYVDASFACHQKSKSHSGMIVTIGENGGPIQVKSKMQKLHSDSSSEAELIATATCVNYGLFVARVCQDVELIPCELLLLNLKQDNMSTIKIIENGEGSGGLAKYMRVRYDKITSLLEEKVVKIVHCPGDDMICDFLTKPMVGAEFLRQIVRAMYHGDYEEFKKQAELAWRRVTDAKKKIVKDK